MENKDLARQLDLTKGVGAEDQLLRGEVGNAFCPGSLCTQALR